MFLRLPWQPGRRRIALVQVKIFPGDGVVDARQVGLDVIKKFVPPFRIEAHLHAIVCPPPRDA
jgi:hypothetical protein